MACVLLMTCPGPKKIQTIKAIREVLGIGLKEAKEVAEGTVRHTLQTKDVDAFVEAMEVWGATYHLEPMGKPSAHLLPTALRWMDSVNRYELHNPRAVELFDLLNEIRPRTQTRYEALAGESDNALTEEDREPTTQVSMAFTVTPSLLKEWAGRFGLNVVKAEE